MPGRTVECRPGVESSAILRIETKSSVDISGLLIGTHRRRVRNGHAVFGLCDLLASPAKDGIVDRDRFGKPVMATGAIARSDVSQSRRLGRTWIRVMSLDLFRLSYAGHARRHADA